MDTGPAELVMIYDLRDAKAWERASRDAGFWGRLYTDIHTLDTNHVALVFRPAGEHWREWERVRLARILEGRERAA